MHVRSLAAAVLGLEAIGLVALLVWQVMALSGGDTAMLSSALALIVLTGIGVLAVAGFALATARGHSAGRSGGIVVQVLILAVALGALTGEGASPALAAAIAAPAAIAGTLLIIAARRAGAEREDEGDERGSGTRPAA